MSREPIIAVTMLKRPRPGCATASASAALPVSSVPPLRVSQAPATFASTKNAGATSMAMAIPRRRNAAVRLESGSVEIVIASPLPFVEASDDTPRRCRRRPAKASVWTPKNPYVPTRPTACRVRLSWRGRRSGLGGATSSATSTTTRPRRSARRRHPPRSRRCGPRRVPWRGAQRRSRCRRSGTALVRKRRSPFLPAPRLRRCGG